MCYFRVSLYSSEFCQLFKQAVKPCALVRIRANLSVIEQSVNSIRLLNAILYLFRVRIQSSRYYAC